MDKKLLKLPILSLIGGIILRIILRIASRFIIRSDFDIASAIGYTNLIASLIILIFIGMTLRKSHKRNEVFKSATYLVIYSFILLGITEALSYMGINSPYIFAPIYNFTYTWLYLPLEIYGIFSSLLLRLMSTDSMGLIYLAVVIGNFSPYLLTIFARRSKEI